MELTAPQFRALRDRHSPFIEAVMVDCVAQACGDNTLLKEMLEYHLKSGGKRLRAMAPVLVFLAQEQDPTQVYPFSATCELLHNATLVHDDLQDGDATRRGSETVWKRWGAAQAINAGDALFLVAQLALDRLTMDPGRVGQVRTLLNRSTLDVISGQTMEFELKPQRHPGQDRYFNMVEGKTSALFLLPLTGAAILAGADESTCNALSEAARHLGVLFQIQDDILDLFGDKGRSQPGNDIREGKMSAMAVHALDHAAATDSARLYNILRAPRTETSPEHVAFVTQLFRSAGSLQFALDELTNRAQLARDAVSTHHRMRDLIGPLTDVLLHPIESVSS